MSREQRVRAMRRSAKDDFYRRQAENYWQEPGVTNWRMLIARRLKIPITEVRRILGLPRGIAREVLTMIPGDKIILDDGDITGEVIAVTGTTHTIRWGTGEVFTYTNDVDWDAPEI